MKGNDLVGKTVYVKPGANAALEKNGYFVEGMTDYEGKTGVVKQFLNYGNTPATNHIVEFTDGAQWSYYEDFLAVVKL